MTKNFTEYLKTLPIQGLQAKLKRKLVGRLSKYWSLNSGTDLEIYQAFTQHHFLIAPEKEYLDQLWVGYLNQVEPIPAPDLAQELEQEFQKGNLKPSAIKRSKSLSDLSPSNPSPPETTRELNLSPAVQGNQVLKAEKEKYQQQAFLADSQLKEKNKQLSQAQTEINSLTEQLASANQRLDKALQVRLANLKAADKQSARINELEKELDTTVKQDLQEFSKLENSIKNLRRQLSQSQSENYSLENKLRLAKINHQPDNSFIPDENNWPSLVSLVLIPLLATGIVVLLSSKRN